MVRSESGLRTSTNHEPRFRGPRSRVLTLAIHSFLSIRAYTFDPIPAFGSAAVAGTRSLLLEASFHYGYHT